MPIPIDWKVPSELSPEETRLTAKLRRIGKFYVFLREIRAALFDEAFEAELAGAYQPRGVAPLPPALLAMVTLLHAYDHLHSFLAGLATAWRHGEVRATHRLAPRLARDWRTRKDPFAHG